MAEYLDESTAEEVARRTAGMALLYGIQKEYCSQSPELEMVEPMPFTLFPSAFPACLLQELRDLQIHHQTLMHRVSNDHNFMYQSLKNVLAVDDFLRHFWEIYMKVRDEGVSQPLSLGLFRNDYMMEELDHVTNANNTMAKKGSSHSLNSVMGSQSHKVPNLLPKQVEFNTFACGSAGLMNELPQIHRYSMTLAGVEFKDEQLPDNEPTVGMASSLIEAWKMYGEDSAVILFVVGAPEPNHPDQRWMERRVFQQNRNIMVIYRRFDQLITSAKLADDKTLLVDGNKVAVVYYRYGFSPKHYPTQAEFDLRLLIERSRSIKCPPINLHLAGSKKIQQELARPGILEKFIKNDDITRKLRATFTGLFSLDEGEEGDRHIEMALSAPEKFVLKPQREGGGNNLFGEELRLKLEAIRHTEERNSYTLMDRIHAYSFRNRLVRVGLDHSVKDVCSEIGIYGALLGTTTEECLNLEYGYLLKTKPVTANEASLFSGLACLDSVLLV